MCNFFSTSLNSLFSLSYLIAIKPSLLFLFICLKMFQNGFEMRPCWAFAFSLFSVFSVMWFSIILFSTICKLRYMVLFFCFYHFCKWLFFIQFCNIFFAFVFISFEGGLENCLPSGTCLWLF